MGIGQGLNDLISLIGALPGLVKVVFKWLFQSIWDIVDGRGDNDPVLTETWATLSGIIETLQELDSEEVKKATKTMISEAHKASIFKASEVAYALYLTAFLAGMIFIEVVVFALGFGAIKSLVTAAKGGGKIKAMNSFLDTSKSIAKSEFDSYARLISQKLKQSSNVRIYRTKHPISKNVVQSHRN